MGRRKRHAPSPSPISIGNCTIEFEGSGFKHQKPDADSLAISFSNTAKIKISVDRSVDSTAPNACGNRVGDIQAVEDGEKAVYPDKYSILLVNPKGSGSGDKLLLQEILKIYMTELPSMNFAANTGKKSQFLERCVVNGKYKTLILRSNPKSGLGEVIAALSFQLVPSDTQFAEIPLAAVTSAYQNQGLGHYLIEELKGRLWHVGVSTILCWADKESEGFWIKQGFISIGDVDKKGRGRRLPIKAEIRRALCFPGGSTLMVAHLSKSVDYANLVKFHDIQMKAHTGRVNSSKRLSKETYQQYADRVDAMYSGSACLKSTRVMPKGVSNSDCQSASTNEQDAVKISMNDEGKIFSAESKHYPCSEQCQKKRVWESSVYSLKSKRVKGSSCGHCNLEVNREASINLEKDEFISDRFDSMAGSTPLVQTTLENSLEYSSAETIKGSMLDKNIAVHQSVDDLEAKGIYPRIMFMDIADETKKMNLTKIIESLGGSVTSKGGISTHVITGKARRTLNFCVALCSGALIVSSKWLKESYREGKFLDGVSFLLEDGDYSLKYKSSLKQTVLKANANPCALFKGYHIFIAKHVQPSRGTLSEIINSAGGTVIVQLDQMSEPSKTIFLASEEDMEEAFSAAKMGVWTYGSEWFMNCIMKQELDFEAPQFAESL